MARNPVLTRVLIRGWREGAYQSNKWRMWSWVLFWRWIRL